jgi:hypothetical protein
MSRHLSWKSGYNYCAGKNRKGEPCGNLVPKGIRYCRYHRYEGTRKP